MKILKVLTILSLFIVMLGLTSCTKEAGIKEAGKLSTSDCPRLASLTAEKKEALYTVSTFAGENYTSPNQPGSGDIIDGVLCKVRFVIPYGIAIDPNGILYIGDQISNVRKIDLGIVSTFAGSTDGGGFDIGDRDGLGTNARFWSPAKIALNKNGTLYVIDQTNSSIRKVSPTAEVTTYIAYQRESGYQDGPLAQAKFDTYFSSIAIGPDGSIFLYSYAESSLIRKITTNGIVSTYAGQIPVNGEAQRGYQDGPKENALFGDITDMAFGPDGELYLCDAANKKLRKITQAGIVKTISDLAARSIAITDGGIIFVASYQQIFRIDPNGMAHVVAGGVNSAYKDGVGTEARFRGIRNMAIHQNYLYLTDGSTVRRMNIE